MAQIGRDSHSQQERVADDALNEALMDTFPGSDPLSIVNTLIPGTRSEHPASAEQEARTERADLSSEWVAEARRQGNLADAVAFFLVLLAVLLVLDARRSYPVDVVAATKSEGSVAVPPM